MDRLRALEPFASRQIEVVERKDRRANPVNAPEKLLQQPRQRRLPGALRAIEPKHERAILDMIGNPGRHRYVEVGDQRISRPRDAFGGTPGVDVGANIGNTGMNTATKGPRPRHEAVIPSPARTLAPTLTLPLTLALSLSLSLSLTPTLPLTLKLPLALSLSLH